MYYRIQNDSSCQYLVHHGILGMKWGTVNGPPYPLSVKNAHSSRERAYAKKTGTKLGKSSGLGDNGGIRQLNSSRSVKKNTSTRHLNSSRSVNKNASTRTRSNLSVSSAVNTGRKYLSKAQSNGKRTLADIRNELNSTLLLGQNRVDTYLKAGTEFKRVQTSKEFENHAYYATYKKHDTNEYAALFGRNLQRRAAREGIKNQKVYQMTLQANKRIRVPSTKNAANVAAGLLRDDEFKSNLLKSIDDSQKKMKRPNQLALFQTAKNILRRKDASKLSDSEKATVYKALNLSLTNHESYENDVQDKFYGALKKKGYGALVDLNDQSYSSYHAKRPMIVFDTDSTSAKSARNLTNKETEGIYHRYNTERLIKDSISTGLSAIGNYGKYGKEYLSEYFHKSRNTRRDYR